MALNEKSAKRKKLPTSDLFQSVLSKLDRIDRRLESIETQQTLTESAWQRQGTLLEEVNKRCMEKLGLQCSLRDNEKEEDEVDGENENDAITHVETSKE